MLKRILRELELHAPFTGFGALTGIVILAMIVYLHVSREVSVTIFWIFHPFHVVLSAIVTTGMYRLHSRGRLWVAILIGYSGSVGIATLSDCIIPYVGEFLLDLPHRGIHLGFIEKWWLVNPLAGLGILIGYLRPSTKLPHAGHVLLSTWASLFHMVMALGESFSVVMMGVILIFLFLGVWIPCCTSDIVFPLLFVGKEP